MVFGACVSLRGREGWGQGKRPGPGDGWARVLGAVLDALPIREPEDMATRRMELWLRSLLPLVWLVWVLTHGEGSALGCADPRPRREPESDHRGAQASCLRVSPASQVCPEPCCSVHTSGSMWLHPYHYPLEMLTYSMAQVAYAAGTQNTPSCSVTHRHSELCQIYDVGLNLDLKYPVLQMSTSRLGKAMGWT